jgi:hypothetical protein
VALDTDLLPIESDWPSAAALRLLKSFSSGWAVIHRARDGDDLYCLLLSAAVAKGLLDEDERPVAEALQLDEKSAAPIRAAETDTAEGLAVVVNRGFVAGVTPGTVKHARGQAVGDENAEGAAKPSRVGTRREAYIGAKRHSPSPFDPLVPEREPRKMLDVAGESINDLNLPTRRLTAPGRSAAMA